MASQLATFFEERMARAPRPPSSAPAPPARPRHPARASPGPRARRPLRLPACALTPARARTRTRGRSRRSPRLEPRGVELVPPRAQN
jgi:hypothetical protein